MNVRIYKDIKFKGAREEVIKKALIDTGAERSLMPVELAKEVSAWRTKQEINIVGIHKQGKKLPVDIAGVFFPSLNNIGGNFLVAVTPIEKEPIIGMDILGPLGISIDARTHQLSVKNAIWEAFKTLSAIGILTYGVIKIIDSFFEEE